MATSLKSKSSTTKTKCSNGAFTFKKRRSSKSAEIIVIDNDDEDDDFKPIKLKSKSVPKVSSNSSNLQQGRKIKNEVGGSSMNFDSDNSSCVSSEEEAKGNLSSDLENLNDVEIIHSVDAPSSSTCSSKPKVEDGKSAWKNLMEQMQRNQQKGTINNASKKSKTGFKRGLINSPVQNKAASDLSKVVLSPLKKNPRLGSSNNINVKASRNLNQDDVFNTTGNDDKINAKATSSQESSCTQKGLPAKEKVAVAPIFLPAAERKVLQTSKAKSSLDDDDLPNSDARHLLNSIIKSSLTTEEEKGEDNPSHFNGNVVLLNLDQPDGDPYQGTKTKTCPFYKKLPGVPFCVDAFNYGLVPGMEVYFLSHFHSDHYIGLTKKFCKTIICSRPTGNLVKMKLYVEEKCIRKLRMNKPYIICDSEVTLIDANHCPGSVMFVFRLKTGQCILHTGDFRYTPEMLRSDSLLGFRTDCLYLDTTYCSPQYNFPTQHESIATAVNQVKRHLEYRPKTLILCGSYLIGKERVYMTLAEAIGSKVFALADKRKIINALENSKFSHMLTGDENAAIIHVTPMFTISAKNLQEYLAKRPQYTNIIGIKPSGWQFSSSGSGCSVKKHYGDTVTVLGIPYSEHSSFSELKEFVSTLRPKRVQPTVNVGNAKKRGEMMQHIENWLSI